MLSHSRALAAATLLFAVSLSAAHAAPLTLEEAWRLAEAANPALRSAKANLSAAEGQLEDARGLLWNNPQISTDRVRRELPLTGLPPERRPEWGVAFSQTFEIAGQHGHRREAAERDLTALQAEVREIRRQTRAEVERRFVRVLALQQRVATEEESLKSLDEAASTVRKRVVAGEDSRLDGNLASVEAERGRNQLAALGENLVEAKSDLAAALQLPSDRLPEATGELVPATPTYTLERLLAAAARRPKARALELREEAATSRLKLERAAVYPDVTVGLTSGREGPLDAREKLVGVTLSVPLPLFRRNAAGIGKASTELAQAQIDRQVEERDAPARVRALWLKVESLRARLWRLEESILAGLDQNRQLSTKAYRAGEIGLLQLLLVNRQVLDGRRDLVDVRTDLRLATVDLELAAGWPEKDNEQ